MLRQITNKTHLRFHPDYEEHAPRPLRWRDRAYRRKRIAERVIREAGANSSCRFAAVRFGNVLGSRGSVVPIFRQQIARGGPVTVTHPDMKRYFMTVKEACLLVLQASALSQGGEVLVLDMSEPVKIVDLARALIRLSGFEPDAEIPIVFSGIRPGEKLFEQYMTAEEGVDATRHAKIFTARAPEEQESAVPVADIEQACAAQNAEQLIALFRKIVPTYGTPPDPNESAVPAPSTARPSE